MLQAPVAKVLNQRGKNVTIECPYCHAPHAHVVENMGQRERRAPACGLNRSNSQRAAGYIFTTTPRSKASARTQEGTD